ncbi:MAG: Zn-dependent exopeptidase M28 [Oligoflexia bacterium]|nr:Zn-dependent exopeptidase M28 [Oligoflexia bacterium]
MKNLNLVIVLLLFLIFVSCSSKNDPESQVIVRINVSNEDNIDDLENRGLPIHEVLEDSRGNEYIVSITTRSLLDRMQLSYQILDSCSGRCGEYLIADSLGDSSIRTRAAAETTVLHDDGKNVIVRFSKALSNSLPKMGFELALLQSSDSDVNSEVADRISNKKLKNTKSLSDIIVSSSTKKSSVETMISGVSDDSLLTYIKDLSGENSVSISSGTVNNTQVSGTVTIRSRITESMDLNYAQQYVYDKLKILSSTPNFLSPPTPSFDSWSVAGYVGSNVIGEIPGKTTPNEIILLVAHLDSIPGEDRNNVCRQTNYDSTHAPGADDNASGSAMLLEIARLMGKKEYDRTIRFLFTTGEEQGKLGSIGYAKKAKDRNDTILAVINLDMNAYWNTDISGTKIYHVKTNKISVAEKYNRDKALSDIFFSAVNTYGLSSGQNAGIVPTPIPDGDTYSDHDSFWNKDYSAIWIIEDDSRDVWNPYMHKSCDRYDKISIPYCANQTKSVLATTAHLAKIRD